MKLKWRDWRVAHRVGENVPVLAVLLALVFSLLALWHLEGATWWTSNLWSQIATNIAEGRGYVGCEPIYFPFCRDSDVTAAREPIPEIVFAGLMKLAGRLEPGAFAIQLFFNLSTVVGVFIIARRLSGARTASFAAFMWAVYWPAIKTFYLAVNGDAIATSAVTWALALYLRAKDAGGASNWILSGICLGVGVLSRSAVIVLVPVLVLCAVFQNGSGIRGRWLSRLKGPILLGLTCGTLVAPWMVRNDLAFHQFVLGTTLADYNLFRHNSILLSDDFLRYVGPDEGSTALNALLERRTDLKRTENEAQMGRVYRQEAWHIISAAPLRYVLLSAYRFFLLWFNWGVDAAYGERELTWSGATVLVQQLLLLLLALIGGLRRDPRLLPVAVSVASFVGLHMPVMGRLYLILPIMPLAVVLAALGATWPYAALDSHLQFRREGRSP